MFSSGFVKGLWQPVLLLLTLPASAQLNPGDTGVSKIVVPLRGEFLIPDSQAVKRIHQMNDELYAAGDVFLYALVPPGDQTNTQPALKRLTVVRNLLMEDGVPDSSIRFNLVGTNTGKLPFALHPGEVLVCYRLPAGYNTTYSSGSERPLCLKDTVVSLMNGVMLYYRLCDFVEMESLPVVETNPAVIEKEIKGSNAEVAGRLQEMLYRYSYTPNVPGRCKDELFFSIPPNTMAQQLQVEWYDDSLGRWTLHRRFSVVKNAKGTFCSVHAPVRGYGRISRVKPSGITSLYIAAPDGMAFREATLKNDNAVVYKGTFTNGGTTVLFLLPESYTGLESEFTLISYDGSVHFAVPGKAEKVLGKKFTVPERYRKTVLIDGQKVRIPEEGFRFAGELDGMRTVNVVND